MASTYELIVQATDKASGPLRSVEKSLGRVEKESKSLTKSLGLISGALAAIGSAGILRSITNTTARFEDLQDTLTTVTGSAQKGAAAFAGIQKFATQTQFGVEELTNTYIKLAGAGINPTTKLLTTFTDAAAVTTDQIGTLNAITDLFSRTTSGGLGLEELNRLADRGLPVFKMLEDQLGLTRLEVSEFGKTAEGARQITEALVNGINQQFGGATQGKMDNLSTAMSNFGIAVTNAAYKIGDEFRPQLTAAISEATEFITTNDRLLKSIGTDLASAIEGSVTALKFLAHNFEVIRNVAIGMISIRAFDIFVGGARKAGGFGNALKNVAVGLRSILKATPVIGVFAGMFGPFTAAALGAVG